MKRLLLLIVPVWRLQRRLPRSNFAEEFLGTWCVADRTDELASLQRAGRAGSDELAVIRQKYSLYYGEKAQAR